jgi:hypothetical protein
MYNIQVLEIDIFTCRCNLDTDRNPSVIILHICPLIAIDFKFYKNSVSDFLLTIFFAYFFEFAESLWAYQMF